jgi:hypothetical protein
MDQTHEKPAAKPSAPGNDRQARILHAVITLAALPGILIFSNFNPSVSRFYPPCLFHSLTGLYCPGCGMTRALFQLIHGHFIAAIHYNIFIVITTPLLAYVYFSMVAYALTGRRPRGSKAHPVLIAVFMALVITFWILRNIPAYPFTWLAPHP